MKKTRIILGILVVILIIGGYFAYSLLKVRTTQSVRFTNPESVRRTALYRHIEQLTVRIGARSVRDYGQLSAARAYIAGSLEHMGLKPQFQEYRYQDRIFANVIISIRGNLHPDETVLVGAHYDTVPGTPGADDNASGVASLLEICRLLKDHRPQRTVKLVFFCLEEPPVFRTKDMGSAVYARQAKREGEKVIAMLCLEMLGYYHDQCDAQTYPVPVMRLFYPCRPNFIGVVGNVSSRNLVKSVADILKRHADLPVESLVAVSVLPGVDFSDHKPFWDEGYPAVMITDTAFYRNPNYHSESDTIETLDFRRLASLIPALAATVKELAG